MLASRRGDAKRVIATRVSADQLQAALNAIRRESRQRRLELFEPERDAVPLRFGHQRNRRKQNRKLKQERCVIAREERPVAYRHATRSRSRGVFHRTALEGVVR